MKKILIGLIFGLAFSLANCFASGLVVKNPYMDSIEIHIRQLDNYSKGNNIGFFSSTLTPTRDIDAPNLYVSSTVNEVEVSLEFLNPKTKLAQLIDKKKLKAVTGGTHGKKTYKKEFLVGGEKAWVEYALNVEFGAGKDPKIGNVLKTLEIRILGISIPRVKKTEL